MQATPSLTLTLVRAVRVSDTSITLSYKTDESSIGQVAYTEADGSKLTLTDSVPQTDHLFTLTELDPQHGYSFALTASVGGATSDTYTVLLAPDSIGGAGQSILPGVQETTASGQVVSTTLAASSTPAPAQSVVPWWAFAILFVLIVCGWILYARRSAPGAAAVPPSL